MKKVVMILVVFMIMPSAGYVGMHSRLKVITNKIKHFGYPEKGVWE